MSEFEQPFDPKLQCVGEEANNELQPDCKWENTCQILGRCILADPELAEAIDEDTSVKSMHTIVDAFNAGFDTAMEEASIDKLTGFILRQYIQDIAKPFTERAAEIGDTHVFVVYADMDHFKRFNDGFVTDDGTVVAPSHQRGDEALRAWSAHARKTVREGNSQRNPDLLIRWGGDEFAIVMSADMQDVIEKANEEQPIDDALDYVEKRVGASLQERLGSVPFTFDGQDFEAGASLAVRAIALPTNGDVVAVIKEVDQQMYDHKIERKLQQQADKMAGYVTEGVVEFS